MAKRKTKSLSAAVSKEIQSKFSLADFKNKKGLDKNVKFKDQEWLPLSKDISRRYFYSWSSNGTYCDF